VISLPETVKYFFSASDSSTERKSERLADFWGIS